MWQYVITDLYGNNAAEVTNADERKCVLPHMRTPTASFKVPLWHYLGDRLLTSDCLLKAYRTDDRTQVKTLAFHGPIITAEEVGESLTQSISCTATGPFWRLSKRLVPGSDTVAGFAYGPADLGFIALTILNVVNGASFTGISSAGSYAPTISGTVGPMWLKNAAEAITDLTLGLNSFEYVISPVEASDFGGVHGWPLIGVMNVASLIRTQRPDAIFEYGTTKANVGSYTRAITRDGMLTRAVVSLSGWPDAPTAGGSGLVIQNSSQILARGMFEEQVNDAGVIDDALRATIASFHLKYRENPREVITFRPVTNAKPSPFTDYNVGDEVRARAVVRGSVRFDALFRIWGVSFDIDKNGNESVELELVMP